MTTLDDSCLSQVLSMSPPSNTLDISILRDPAVLDIDTFNYFKDVVVVQMDTYPMNNIQPTVYDIADTTNLRTNIVVIKTTASDIDLNVIIAVVVVVVVIAVASCCLLIVLLRRRQRSSEKKNTIGMDNKGVEGYE